LLLALLIGSVSPEAFSSVVKFLFCDPIYLLLLLVYVPLTTFPLILTFQLMMHFLYGCYSISERVRAKIVVPALVLWQIIIGTTMQRNFIYGLALILASLVFIKLAKTIFSRCPICRGRIVDQDFPPRCSRCSASFNEQFFVSLHPSSS